MCGDVEKMSVNSFLKHSKTREKVVKYSTQKLVQISCMFCCNVAWEVAVKKINKILLIFTWEWSIAFCSRLCLAWIRLNWISDLSKYAIHSGHKYLRYKLSTHLAVTYIDISDRGKQFCSIGPLDCTRHAHHKEKYHCASDLLFDWFGFNQTSKAVANST